jgi:hypothetical protein
VVKSVDDGDDVRLSGVALALRSRNERPELVDVDRGLPGRVARQVEVTHTDLSEVTGVILVEVGPARYERRA